MRIFSDDFQGLYLSPTQKLIYIFLSSVSDDSGFISISTNDISNRVGCSRVSVSNSISYLKSVSLIHIYRGSSIGEISSYSVLDPFKDDSRQEPQVKAKESRSEYEERMEAAHKIAREAVADFRREKERKSEEERRLNPQNSPLSGDAKRTKNRAKRKKKKKG